MDIPGYFLPYQVAWLRDRSPIKIWEKSRRIGATYAQAYEDVYDCLNKTVPAVWFSSADDSAGKEYIRSCAKWAKLFNAPIKDLGTQILDEKNGIKTNSIEFANGIRINALTSNPKGFRSKEGKIILDEFAFHDSPDELWAAAQPCTLWGFPLRILSTHNGKNCKYYQFVEKTKAKKLNWSLHSTSLKTAVEQGLADKICRKKLTLAQRVAWMKNIHDNNCATEDVWLQEYCCIPVDEATAFLTYDLIRGCVSMDTLMDDLSLCKAPLYLGMDVARHNHLSVITVVEDYGIIWIRKRIEMRNQKYSFQEKVLWNFLAMPNLRRGCIDNTGIGNQLAERAQDQFGKYKVEGVTFSNEVKEDLAYPLRTRFEDHTIKVPDDEELHEDYHSVRKIVTAAGNVRLDAAATANGHGDNFWSLALANHAVGKSDGSVRVSSSTPTRSGPAGYDTADDDRNEELKMTAEEQYSRRKDRYEGY